jgi:hypothetical protein
LFAGKRRAHESPLKADVSDGTAFDL